MSSGVDKTYLYRHSNPTREAYGFALSIFAVVVWVLWIVWALCPESFLIRVGIQWYPHRDWAYLIPAWSIALILFIYLGFFAMNIYHTPPIDSMQFVTDQRAVLFTQPMSQPDQHPLEGLSLYDMAHEDGPLNDDIYDISPGLYCRAKYLHG